jgi:hypothetical protein
MSDIRVTRVVLHIDRLNLRGIGHGERTALVDAVRAALAQQLSAALADPAVAVALAGRPAYQANLTAGRAIVDAGPTVTGSRLGRQIARSLTR